ncbi:MAG: 6-pyruvoyl-tetrahydropterin synthase-related protein, partial [Candidatus Bathyarchaeia archaeon]
DRHLPLLLAVLTINILFASPRLLPGLPSGVDSSSHLYRAIFMYDSYNEYGYIPDWTPGWYGGTYLFLLYPPLAYLAVFLFAQIGLGPILAYKLIEVIFYAIAPLTVYLLLREFRIERRVRLVAVALFVFNPLIVENYLFYDRFPNIVALPLMCLFLVFTHRLLKGGSAYYLAPSGLLLTALILVHHLSALYAALITLILAITDVLTSKSKLRPIALFCIMILAAVGASGFWLFQFLKESGQMGVSHFFNRNVIDDAYMKITYFLRNMAVYSFGIAHLVLGLVAIVLALTGPAKRVRRWFILFFPMLLGSLTAFDIGVTLQSGPIRFLSQVILLAGFIMAFASVMKSSGSVVRERSEGYLFLILWFILFFWFSLGGYAVPFSTPKAIPYLKSSWISTLWMSLDVQRFWLFLVTPMSALGAEPLTRLIRKASLRSRSKETFLTAIIMLVVVLGGSIKAYYSLTQPISEHLPSYLTASNSVIPQDLIDYFKSSPLDGRILGIRCPLWIYLLPCYTGKPLIDGWYPQGRLLGRILEINDYRINDLEVSNSTERIRIWRSLVADSEALGIDWVIFGDENRALQNMVIGESGFIKVRVIPYGQRILTIYQSPRKNPLITFEPPDHVTWYTRPTPDKILIKYPPLLTDTEVTVREAYAATWRAQADGVELPVTPDENGFIRLQVPQKSETIYLYHENRRAHLNFSIMSLFLLLIVSLLAGRLKI